MVFHLSGVYGEKGADATMAEKVLDAAFMAARVGYPAVFAANSADEPARQAKFEHVCVTLAQELAKISDERLKQGVLEGMIDRLEVGLREAGVGDMVIGKHVRTYAAALNGRLLRYMLLINNNDMAGLQAACAEHGVGPVYAGKA